MKSLVRLLLYLGHMHFRTTIRLAVIFNALTVTVALAQTPAPKPAPGAVPSVKAPTPTPTPKQEPARPLEVRMNDIRNNCLKRDWAQIKCEVTSKFGDLYERFGSEAITEKLDSSTMSFAKVKRVVLGLKKEEDKKIREIYEELSKELGTLRKDKNLKDCQSACLVSCVTSKLAVYDHESRAKGFETEDSDINIIIRGAGVCRHYAEVATGLSELIGLDVKASVSESGNHAFLGVKVDGRWSYIEPQLDTCKFYQKDGERSGATVGAEKRMWFEDSDLTPPKPITYIPQGGTTALAGDTHETPKSGDATAEAASPSKPKEPSASVGSWISDRAFSASPNGPATLFGSIALDRYGMSVGSTDTGSVLPLTGNMLGVRLSTRVVDTEAGRVVAQLGATAGTGAFSFDGQVNLVETNALTSSTGDGSFYSVLARPANFEFQLSTDGANSVAISPEVALNYKTRGDFITSDVAVRIAPLVWGYVPTMTNEDPSAPLGQKSIIASRLAVDGSTQFALNDLEHIELSAGVEKLMQLNKGNRLADNFALRMSLVYARNTEKGGSWYIGLVGEERTMLNTDFAGITFGIRPPH